MNLIAILFEYPTLNGGERSMLQAIDLVDPAEFRFVAIAPAEGRLAVALQDRSIDHRHFECRDKVGVRFPRDVLVSRLVELIRHISPSLLHANSLAMGRLTGAATDEYGAPTVAHLRDIMNLSNAAIDDLNRNSMLLAVSQATKEFHVSQGIAASKTQVLYNGVDCHRFHPRPADAALGRQLSLPIESFVILSVGQIGLRKGQDTLADAAPLIVSRVPNAHFVIAGERNSSKSESVEFERALSARFESYGLADRLHMLGYRDDVDQLMNNVDLLVHPAKQEPLGRVLLEAAASGLPIVATAVGGTAEILKDGVSGLFVSPGNANELARAVVRLAEDPPLRRRLGLAARARIVADFNAGFAADQLSRVWRSSQA